MTGPPAIFAVEDHPGHTRAAISVQLLHIPDCPRVDAVRDMLRRSLAKTGARVTFEDVEGPYPSPTLLIDCTDVTGYQPESGPSRRLDLPTEDAILAALRPSDVEDAAS